jgi:membrane fusion protein, multidrug efflux system
VIDQEPPETSRFTLPLHCEIEETSKLRAFFLPKEQQSENHLPSQKAWITELRKVLFSKRSLQGLAIFIALIFAKSGLNYAFRSRPKTVALSVHVTKPVKQALDSNLTLPGNMEAVEMASLYAHVAGYLKKIYVDEGDEVKQGQLLADIDAPDIIDEFDKSKAALDFKTVTRNRYRELLDDKVISQQEFDAVDSAFAEEKSRYGTAAANMNYTHIRAPFSGSIARRYKYPGDLISSANKGDQNPIFLLVNEATLRVVINVPQIDLANVQVGSPVDIHVDTFPDRIFTGMVSRLDKLLDASTKTQRVLIDIDNADRKLHAGMFGSVVLHFQHKDEALTIPLAAVDTEGDKHFVFLVKDGKAKKTAVTIGAAQGDKVEVTDGLDLNSNVILKGTATPTEDLPVQIVAGDTN